MCPGSLYLKGLKCILPVNTDEESPKIPACLDIVPVSVLSVITSHTSLAGADYLQIQSTDYFHCYPGVSRQWTAWKLHSFLHNKNHLVHEAFVLFVSSRPLSMWTLEQTKSWHRMQILLRELSIVLKLLSEIILLKFNLGTTFNYLTIFLGVLPFCFKIFFIIFSNKTPVSGGRDTTQES